MTTLNIQKIKTMEQNITAELLKSLAIFQGNCDPIPMNQTVKVKMKSGGEYSFKYADLGQIHEICKPLLSDVGLAFAQIFEGMVLVTVIFHAESKGFLVSKFDLTGFLTNKGTQDAGGVITYFKRYTLAAILGIISDEDDDANAATGNVIAEKKTAAPAKPWLNPGTEQWTQAVKYLADGGNLEDITRKYAISKANREKLLSESI